MSDVNWSMDIERGQVNVPNFYYKSKWISPISAADYLNALEKVAQKMHEQMDELNNNAGGHLCWWCGGEGYDGDGLIHKADCALVKFRQLDPRNF